MPKLTMTWGDEPAPKRGDRLIFPRTTYFVLHVHAVKRRGWKLPRKFVCWCYRLAEVDEELKRRLYRSAFRRGGSTGIHCTWNPRKKKVTGDRAPW